MTTDEVREGVTLTNLDESLFDGAGTTKRELLDYLDAVSELLLTELTDRPLSMIRVLRGQAPFMQKNVPKYTPAWVRTVSIWAADPGRACPGDARRQAPGARASSGCGSRRAGLRRGTPIGSIRHWCCLPGRISAPRGVDDGAGRL